MPIITEQKIETDRSVLFLRNPLVELMSCIHVLGNAEHHEQWAEWAKEIRGKIDSEKLDYIDYLYDNYYECLFLMDVASDLSIFSIKFTDQTEFDVSFKKLKEMPMEIFACQFLGGGALNIDRAIVKKWIDNKGEGAEEENEFKKIQGFIKTEKILEFLRNPLQTKDKIVNLIEYCWDVFFEDLWEEISKHAIFLEKEQLKKYEKLGFSQYLSSQFPLIQVKNDKLLIEKQVVYDIEVSKLKDGFVFLSAFTSPHLMIDIDEDNLILYFNMYYQRKMMGIEVQERTKNLVSAISDATRLQILRLLEERPLTTEQLSEMLHLSPSTISIHLKKLKLFGFLESESEKKFVYYSVNKEVLGKEFKSLKEYLNITKEE